MGQQTIEGDVFPDLLLCSTVLSNIQKDTLVLYFVLRKKRIRGIGIRLDEIAKELGMSENTIHRCIKDLRRRQWVQKDLQLEEDGKWFMDDLLKGNSPSSKEEVKFIPDVKYHEDMVNFIKMKVESLKERAAERVRVHSLGTPPPKHVSSNGTLVLKKFLSLWDEIFKDEVPPKMSMKITRTVSKRIAQYAGNDIEHAFSIMENVFRNWEKCRSEFGLKEPRPNLMLFGTMFRWQQFTDLKRHGFSYSVKNRVVMTGNEKKIGW